jgi:hypothetical protein
MVVTGSGNDTVPCGGDANRGHSQEWRRSEEEMMTEQSTFTPIGVAPTGESSDARTVAQSLVAVRRVENMPASAIPLGARPSMSSVERAKALYCAKMGKTRL